MIKTGDTVKILSGKDKGKTGKVSQVFPALEKIVVDGVNKMIKHLRARNSKDKGEKVEFFAPVHVSNVAIICNKCNRSVRVKTQILADGKKMRVCKKCGETLDGIHPDKK